MTTYNLHGNPATPILGRGLAHLKSTLDERAILACAAMLGTRPYLPSQGEAANAFNVPASVLRQYLKVRRENGNGQAPAPVAVEETNGSAPDVTVDLVSVHSIIMGLLNATPAQRAEVARELGCDWVWDHLIMPCMRSSVND